MYYFLCFVQLITSWIERCKDLGVPVSEDFSLINVLADPYEIRQWNADGLPRDSVRHHVTSTQATQS
jgi:dynein heavy chain